jgi:hypothetical protein
MDRRSLLALMAGSASRHSNAWRFVARQNLRCF